MPAERSHTTVIRNALLINEGVSRRADTVITGDHITAILPPGEAATGRGVRVIDASGLWLLPGVIDSHVHFREPGLTHKGDIASESAAAAAGGVTSFIDMPNTIPQTVTLDEWQRKNELAASSSLINYSFYLGATNSNIELLRQADPHQVPAVKLFLGASTGNMLVSDHAALEALFSLSHLPLVCHCEDEQMIRENIALYRDRYGERATPSLHPLVRSREAALASSQRAVELAGRGGAKLHLLHLSTAEETRLLTTGDDPTRKQVTGEACVHHLWFDESSYATKGNLIKWNPPVRSSTDREALVKAVRDGLIDIISTDHAPHTAEEKGEPYFTAPSGGPNIQHSLVMMLELCRRGELTPTQVVTGMCHNPAKLFGITGRGFIREGYKADLVLVDPDSPTTVSRENILYKCRWSPVEGTTFSSSIITTFVNGAAVYKERQLTGRGAPEMLRYRENKNQ